MAEFIIIRLGKTSVPLIKQIDKLKGVQNPAFSFALECSQVDPKLNVGTYVFVWLGSDNPDGSPTAWKKGLRALGRVTGKSGGPNYKDKWTIKIDLGIVLPRSIDKVDYLATSPAAYYWFSDMEVVGVASYANQLVQPIKPAEERQNIQALFYALNAACPGFRGDVETAYPALNSLWNYTPPVPEHGVKSTGNGEPQKPNAALSGSFPLPDKVPLEWVLALASNGFVIATGQAGTGKSKIARDIALALDYGLAEQYAKSVNPPANCLAFIPVGADWTDPTPILGFRNPFGKERLVVAQNGQASKTNENYEATSALLLLLRAVAFPDQPHFLLLDEMNLSHVERYFSPFLSIMQTNRGLDSQRKVNLIDAGSLALIASTLEYENNRPLEVEIAKKLSQEGRGLVLPPNVFIIGTVNIDETTYMFSPKVLDRAHVLEIRMGDPVAYFENTATESKDNISRDDALNLFRTSIIRRREGYWESTHPLEILKSIAEKVALGSEKFDSIRASMSKLFLGIYTILDPVGFGYAYRSLNEIAAYMAVYLELGDDSMFGPDGWTGALDRAVYQKVLPKIHGNRRQLGQSLKALGAFLEGKSGQETHYSLSDLTVEISESDKLPLALPLSVAKLRKMNRRLESGYTSFVE